MLELRPFIATASLSLLACQLGCVSMGPKQQGAAVNSVRRSGDSNGQRLITLVEVQHEVMRFADEYLDKLRQLASGDAATQAEIFADAESLATSTPHPSTNLRFALVLATPGHSGSDSQRAQSMLRDLRAQTDGLTAAEIDLTEIYLRAVDDRVSLTSVSRASEQATKRRIAAIEAENQRLRSELADAEGKLEAITSIERSIREQGR